MKQPYFSSAKRTVLNYIWDSRTVTGVLKLPPCRNRQTLSLSVMSGVRTPDGEPALLVRALGSFAARTFTHTQDVLMEKGDFAGCGFQWKAPRVMTVRLEFMKRRRTFRCREGWNSVKFEIPAAHRAEGSPETISVHFDGMKENDIGYLGTLKFYLRTDRDAEAPVIPCREIRKGADWQECDLSDLYVRPGTVLDFSGLIPDEKPDETGRVTASKDGHFTYEKQPGKHVRFFGHSMALTRSTIPETHEEIEAFADALRNQGYNLVRIHGVNALLMDASQGWDGVLPGTPEEIPVDRNAEERLHYFIYALRERCIRLYLDMCTFINGWHRGDVWIGGGIWIPKKHGETRYSSQLLEGDPEVCANYRAGVFRVMTARNPYTGLRLADDPCIAFVLGFNELLLHPCDEWHRRLRRSKKSEAELQYETLERTSEFIDRTIRETGYTGLINQYDNSRRLVNLAVGSRYPSVTNHLYHWCPHKFFYPGSSQGTSSTLFSGIGYLRQAARLRSADKPYGITEYGEPYWNAHRYQQGLGFGAYSAFQDFDMLILHSTPVMKSGGELRPFSGGNDPAIRAAEVVTSCAFQRRDVAPAKHRAVWEFSRNFMMRYFNRMPASQGSFAALLTGVALAFESHPEADLHFPLELAPENEYFGPEFFEHFRGSEKFGRLVAELRKRGILRKENTTDPANGIYETETGELKLDIIREILTAVTSRLEGAILPAGVTACLPHMKIRPGNIEGALSLIAQDGLRDLDTCRRALLICGTNALNTGSRFYIQDEAEKEKLLTDTEGRIYRTPSGEEILLDNGHIPVLRQVRRGSFEVRLPGIRKPELYAVAFNGVRTARLPFTCKKGLLCFELGESPSPFFEIADGEIFR